VSVAEDTALVAWVRAGTGLGAANVFFAQQEPDKIPSGAFVTLNEISRRGVGLDWLRRERNALTLADDVVEAVDTGADTLTLTAHLYETGDGPVQVTTTDTLPGGLELETDYWLIVDDEDTVRLAARFLDAVADTPVPVDITSAGTGTHTIVDTADTLRRGEEIEYVVEGVREIFVSVQAFAGVTSGEVGTPVGAASPRALLETLRQRSLLPSVRAGLLTAGLGLADFGDVQDLGAGMDATIFEPRARADVRFIAHTELRETGTIIETIEVDNELSGTSAWLPAAP
jgi:hypothetical protein